MRSIDDLVQFVAPEVPGATTNEVKFKLREALRSFCIETEAWRQKIVIDQVEDQTEYDVIPEGDATISRIIHVKIKQKDADTFEKLSFAYQASYEINSDGLGITFYTKNAPKYDITDGIEVEIALLPTIYADNVTDDLIDRYAEGIFSYAKYLLMMMPGKMFYKPELASHWAARYRGVKSTAIREKFVKHKDSILMVSQRGGIL